MIWSRAWKQKDLKRRLKVWEPRIGKQAATTYAHGMWWGQYSAVVVLLWVIIQISLEATKHTGVPVAIVAFILWPLFFYCAIKSIRLRTLAGRQATAKVATWKRANVPVSNVKTFDKWAAKSEYYRFKDK